MRLETLLLGPLLLWASHASMEAEHNEELRQKMLDQTAALEDRKKECEEKILSQPRNTSGLSCSPLWDGILCWPSGSPGNTMRLQCPDYVAGFNTEGYASRTCMFDGTWYFDQERNLSWANYSECSHNRFINTEMGSFDTPYNGPLLQTYIPVIKVISQIGYSVSLFALLIALFILAVIKKLRCPRNNLHMHLFSSFIFRAFISLLKNNLFVEGVALPSHVVYVNGSISHFKEHDGWECKLVTSLLHYCLMANYCWILMEGLYLHNLIFLALFSDNSGICLYVALGWGLPLLIISPWITMRVHLENTICWTMNDKAWIFWVLRGPITLSIVINFFFFINISRILFLKLTSSHAPDSRKYRKLAKSTLVLVPLFGVHYMAFLTMSVSSGLDAKTEVVWLFCDQLFASFQGFFVAVLYCFMNGEVQAEIRKKWQNWYTNHGGGTGNANGRSSMFTQSLSYFSKTRNSTTSAVSCNKCSFCWLTFRFFARKLNCSDSKEGDRQDKGGRSSGRSPHVQRTDCSSYTSYYNNHSNTPSPCLPRHSDNSATWSYYPATSENNLTSFVDKSPTVEEARIPRMSLTVEPPNALTPMLNGIALTNDTRRDQLSPMGENLGLLYMERLESTGENESAV